MRMPTTEPLEGPLDPTPPPSTVRLDRRLTHQFEDALASAYTRALSARGRAVAPTDPAAAAAVAKGVDPEVALRASLVEEALGRPVFVPAVAPPWSPSPDGTEPSGRR